MENLADHAPVLPEETGEAVFGLLGPAHLVLHLAEEEGCSWATVTDGGVEVTVRRVRRDCSLN